MKLNLGAGSSELPGYIPLDRKCGEEIFPLKYPDGSVDSVYASHCLEHFSHRDTFEVLKEWVRVLKPGGTIRIAVPNIDWCIECLERGEGGQWPVEAFIMGGHTDRDDHHGAIFNEGKLRALFSAAGLQGIRRWKSTINDCASLPVSLNLMGHKPTGAPPLKLSAVMSSPRLGFTDNFSAVENVVRGLNIPCRIRQGVFWGQTLTAAIETTIAEDQPDALLFIDYDSVFDKTNVMDLIWLLQAHPHADAIAATQIGRDRDSVLLTVKGADGQNEGRVRRADVEDDLLRVSTCHFGLTIIRASAFAKLEKPWFLHHPDPRGGWGEGRTDEDIHFWRLAEKAGLGVFQANHVRIGHLQLVVTWPTWELGPKHQYVVDYRKEGKPNLTGASV